MIEFEMPEASRQMIREFTLALGSMGRVAGASLEDILTTIKNLVQEETPVGETGNLKAGWSSVSQVAGGYSFENRVPYAYVPEEGRYRGEGPRTIRSGGRVYSSQAPEGMTTPVLTNEALINRSILFVLSRITEALEG